MPELFDKDGHQIWWGDTIEVLETNILDNSIDLIFADPPYNIGKQFGEFHDSWESEEAYTEWCKKWLDLCIRKLRPSGSLYVMTSTQAMPYLDLYLRNRLVVRSRIVWHYDSSGVQAKRYFGSLYEPILYCAKDPDNCIFNADDIRVEARTGATRKLIDYRKPTPTLYSTTKVPGNVWYFPRVRYRMDEYEDHPSQKPEVLLERIIQASSNIGHTILDPFAGTFTAAAVAQRLKRKSISIEQNGDYIKIGLRRLQIATNFNGELLHPPQKSYQKQPEPNGNFLFA